MKRVKFRVEMELTGLTPEKSAQAIADHFGTKKRTQKDVGYYVKDKSGRRWSCDYNESFNLFKTPFFEFEDFKTIHKVSIALEEAGAKPERTLNMSIYVDANKLSAKTLVNLANIIYRNEDEINDEINADYHEQRRRKVDVDFLRRVEAFNPETMEDLKLLWYNFWDGNRDDFSQYQGLDLHSVFYKGVIGFKFIRGSFGQELLRSIKLCLALVNKAFYA